MGTCITLIYKPTRLLISLSAFKHKSNPYLKVEDVGQKGYILFCLSEWQLDLRKNSKVLYFLKKASVPHLVFESAHTLYKE